ncbi:hypothetical protein [Pisciglobus halotolerans]|uniref:Nucleoside 2-deoxyribosyltransferase n=1 Tax=Pisciglobus halotolerans TaxID=745365 RepID=A0A1I3DLP4_9LACT|nr:hypothetical protein [Pisciglobus halotolerans]SFH87640.1 hypothetical protein SAMN04489868_1438 [Pisciglobus halotolerans]
MNKCFYITPIGDKKSSQYEKLEGLEENVLKPILKELEYEIEIAHTIDSPGSITDQIFERIVNSELVIVNLTGLNPNVMYELAVRHSFGKPCIMICESDTKLPFDLLADRTIFYEDTIKGSGELKNELKKKIQSANESELDNPVTRAVSKAKVMEATQSDPLKVVLSEIDSLGRRLEKIEFNSNRMYKTDATLIESNAKQKRREIAYIELFERLSSDLGRKATPEEIAKELGISYKLSANLYLKLIDSRDYHS